MDRVETKKNKQVENGREMGVLSEDRHVLSLSTHTKTAFSALIVPHSFKTFTEGVTLRGHKALGKVEM